MGTEYVVVLGVVSLPCLQRTGSGCPVRSEVSLGVHKLLLCDDEPARDPKSAHPRRHCLHVVIHEVSHVSFKVGAGTHVDARQEGLRWARGSAPLAV